MTATRISQAAGDLARDIICREFSRMLGMGAFAVRARIVQPAGNSPEVWFYAHLNSRWDKQPEQLTVPDVVAAVHEALEELASSGHHDAWSGKAHETAEYCDFEFRFHRDAVQRQGVPETEREVRGLLFSDRHDSRKDVRRSIRTPRS